MKKRNHGKVLIINLLVMLVLILITELIFGAWLFPENRLKFFGVLPDMEEQFETDISSELPIIVRHTRDRFGLRGASTFDKPEDIDILTIGGSTTFQKYIDDSDTWQAHLEAQIKASGKTLTVSNAGINGHSTHAHIKSFDIWLSTIEGLNPSYIFFYVGINDFLPRPFLMAENAEPGWLKARLQYNSILYNTLRRIKGFLRAKEIGFETLKVDFSNYHYTTNSLLTEEYLEFYQKEYVSAFKFRIQKLIDLSLKMGAEPVFITQPMMFYKLNNEKLSGVDFLRYDFVSGQPVNGVDAYTLITQLNEGINDVCGQKYKVVELTSLPIWQEEDFHDWIHNTSQGVKKIAEEIWKQLSDHL